MRRRLLYLAPLVLIVASSIMSVVGMFLPATAGATGGTPSSAEILKATFNWVDRSTITGVIGGNPYTFKDTKTTDDNWKYEIQGYPCFGTITLATSKIDSKPGTGSFDMDHYPDNAASTTCEGVKGANGDDFPIGSTEKSNLVYKWVDSNHITRLSGESGWSFTKLSGFTNPSGASIFLRDSEKGDKCQDRLVVPSNNQTAELWVLDDDHGDHAEGQIIGGLDKNDPTEKKLGLASSESCYKLNSGAGGGINSGVSMPLANVENATAAPAAGGGGGTDAGGGGGDSDSSNQIGCDYVWHNPLTWIICPIISLMGEFTAKVDAAITHMLEIDPNVIFCSDKDNPSCNAYYAAWQTFRNLALGLMVIGGLVMLIAQALGMEILDAYTVRKVLPRLMFAAIAITVSWPVMQFAVTLSNDLGLAVRHLIYDPFLDLNQTIKLNLSGGLGSSLLGALAGGTVAVAGSIWLVFGGAGIVLAMLATAGLAVLVALLVLVFRQVAITLMIILAPVALVAFILPNTQRVYHFWWESFSKALLMFPLIAGFIAAGRVFSAIAISQTDATGVGPTGFLWNLVAFTAYFAPYFLIPATFKLAGGAIRQIGGFVNDRGRGGFDRLKGYRQQRGKKGREDFAHKAHTEGFGNVVPARFTRLNRMGRGVSGVMNATGRHATSGIRGGYGFGARGRTAAEAHLQAAKESALKEEAMQKNGTSNGFMRLMTLTAKHHGNEAEAVKELRGWYASDKNEYNRKFEGDELEGKIADAQARMRNVGGYTAGRAAAAFVQMGADGTAIRNVEDMGNIASWVSEGSTSTAYNLISEVSSVSKQRGRSSLSPSQDNRAALADAVVRKHNGEVVGNYDQVLEAATMSGAGGDTGLSVLSGSPSREVRGRVDDAMRILEKYESDPDSVGFGSAAQAAAVVLDLKNNVDIGYGTTDNKKTFQDAMDIGDRREKLQKFLSSPRPDAEPITVRAEGPVEVGAPTATGVVMPKAPPTAQITPTTFEYVKTLVGEKYSSMPQDQLAALQDQARQQQQQQDQQQQP